MSFYPSAKTLLKTAAGKTILEVRRSMRSILKSFFYFFVAVGGVWILAEYGGNIPVPDLPVIRHLSVRWLAIIPALMLLEIVRKYHDDLYVFSDERITHHAGRLSLDLTVPSVRYSDIRGIFVEQDIFARLLDYGNLSVGTAGHEGVELVFTGVRAPRELADLIDELRNYRRTVDGTHELAPDASQARGE